MRPVHITNCAVVTALGNSLDTLWEGLMQSRSGIGPVDRFSTQHYVAEEAALVPGLRRRGRKSLLHDVTDRLFADFGSVPKDCRLLFATTKAGIDNFEMLARGLPADMDDLSSAAFLAAVKRRFGLRDSGININAACASSTIAIARAAAMIAAGAADSALVCSMDLVSEFVFSGFSALKAMTPTRCRPFDKDRSGLTLGEGAAALLLMAPETMARERRQSLGRVCGWGIANDANHMTSPARDGCGLVIAIRKALAKAGIARDRLAGISAHGTGTVYNDLMELTAFRTIFGEHRLPIHGVKGAIGHTLGAAGAIETALATRMLRERIMPPTVGLNTPEPGAEHSVKAHAQMLKAGCLLSTNSGFGGINAALTLCAGAKA